MGSPDQFRGTRHQRDAQQAMTEASARRKRRFKVVAGALAVTAVVGLAAFHDRIPFSQSPNTPPAVVGTIGPREGVGLSDDALIEREANKLPITQVQKNKEIELWRNGFQKSDEKLSIDDHLDLALARAIHTIDLMLLSENPILRIYGEYLDANLDADNLRIDISREPLRDASGMVTKLEKDPNGKIFAHVLVSANEVLNNTNALLLAIELAHEARHIQGIFSFQISLNQPFSADTRIAKQEERMNFETKEYVEEEARGYAIESEAYLYAFALGYRGGNAGGNNINRHVNAASYIRFGSDQDSLGWKQHVATALLRGGIPPELRN